MRHVLVSALLGALAFGGAAFAEEPNAEAAQEEAAFTYRVLEENVSIPFGARQVDSFRVGRDGSLILRVGVSRWYRATLYAPCARDLRWENDIAIRSGGGTGSVDRFSYAIVDGNRCQFRTLDQIEDPRVAERAADEATAAG